MNLNRISLIIALGLLALAGCTKPLDKFEYIEPKMGTSFRMVLYAADQQEADAAAKAAFARVDALNAILSDYDPDSELSKLSANSKTSAPTAWTDISDELGVVLLESIEMSKKTGGAFDITVGPLVDMWRKARKSSTLPDDATIATAKNAVESQFIELKSDHRQARLMKPDMRLDLGGIAKGYIVDETLKTLKTEGIRHALVDAGGDLGVIGTPQEEGRGDGWRIAVQSLQNPGETTGEYLIITDMAVATSGDTYRFVEIDGVRYSHIINPKTGLGLSYRIGVTIVAMDAMTADAMASSVSVLGAERGMALIEATPGVECRIVTIEDGQSVVNVSAGWMAMIKTRAELE